MKLIKMQYKDYSFSINPNSIKLENAKNLSSQNVLDDFEHIDVMSVKPTVIVGSGILVGEYMYEQMEIMQQLFSKNGSDYLFIPGLRPVKAYFSELSFKLSSDENFICYDFKFVQDCNSKRPNYCVRYTIAKKGENLYDIANRLGVSVERLVKHNDFEDLFDVCEGDRVYYA